MALRLAVSFNLEGAANRAAAVVEAATRGHARAKVWTNARWRVPGAGPIYM
jgi:hypothetical protein